jgi:hypothetical protein
MPLVKVWNDNVHPYREEFRDKKIVIPAKGHIEMELDEAQLFKGSFASVPVDADGNPTPEGYKMIRIEAVSSESTHPEVKATKCMACSKDCSSVQELQDHIFADHKDIAVIDEEAEKALKTRKTRASG